MKRYSIVLLILALTAGAFSQTPGQNVNMVSGKVWPGGDPFLQRQNEPSLAISTRNPRHVLAGANDYRTVDLPAVDVLPGFEVTGDAWLGMYKSYDGGATWRSTLLPGFPQDNTPTGLASPLKGFTTAADAVVRAGSNGMFYFSGIAFDRGANKGQVFVSRFVDLNNKENGDPRQNQDSIRYVSAAVIDHGSAGQFLDKPWIATDVPRGTATCTIQVPQNGTTVSQVIPAGNVYIAYTVIVGNDVTIRTKLYLSRSTDCGATWSTPTKLSEGYPINQGATVQVDPTTGYVYVAWRQFAASNSPNAITIVRSTDFGATFTKGVNIVTHASYDATLPNAVSFFDQGTTTQSFRTNSFPTMAIDQNGRVYVAWSERRPEANNDARIVITSSSDFVSWSAPAMVDNQPITDEANSGSFSRGHQFIPQLTFTDGRLMALYYDERFTHTTGHFTFQDPFTPYLNGSYYQETRAKRGELDPGDAAYNPSAVFSAFLSDTGLTAIRHTIEVRVGQSAPGSTPAFNTTRVSQYKLGTRGDGTTTLQQLEINPPNLPLFQQGQVPFMGDYIDIAGLTMVNTANGWKFNSGPTPSPVYVASFTSNQDVRPPKDGNWTHYTPPGTVSSQGSIYQAGAIRPDCVAGQEGMRNQNIYSSLITQGLQVSSPQNNKPLSSSVQRAFAILVQNSTNFDRSFRLSLAPFGGFASFIAAPNPPVSPLPAATSALDVIVAAHSSVARNVYALSSSPTATITVNVDEITAPAAVGLKPAGLKSFVVLNTDPTAPGLIDPDGNNTGSAVSLVEIYNPNVSNPNVSNPNVSNPNVSNPNVSNPNVSNPNVSNPNVSNPNVSNDVVNPNVSNPNVSNPNVSNPNVSNPNVSNPNVSNAPVTDATYSITNTGNTSTSYTVQLVGTDPGTPLQLIISKPYSTPDSVGCTLVDQNQNQPVVNINNASVSGAIDLSNAAITNPNVSNATIALAPGETALVTIRGENVTIDQMNQILTHVTTAVVAQAANTNDPTNTPSYSATLPDLIVDSFTHSPATPSTTDQITLTAVVKNIGTVSAGPSLVRIKAGGEGQPPSYAVPVLAAGQSFSVTRNVVLNVAQSYLNTATADANNNVVELVETNNVKTDSFVVAQSNLAFVTQPSAATVGQPIKPAVRVQALDNSGAAVPGNNVTLSLGNTGTNPGGGALYGTLSAVTDATGVATFSDLVIDSPGDGYTLVANGSGTQTATSTAFSESNPTLITLENLPNGQPTCGNCQASTQFSTFGLSFSFTPTNASQPQLFVSSVYDPANEAGNHSIGNFSAGTMVMYVSRQTGGLEFQLRGNSSIPEFPVAAFDSNGNPLNFSRNKVFTYTAAGGSTFRQETIDITSSTGISRVEFNNVVAGQATFAELVDNVFFFSPIF